MKYLVCLFFTFLITHNVFASTLCEGSCDLVISFTDGGSITADEALQISFGSGGALNLGAAGTINTNPQPVSSDYVAGGVLLLAKGDSITFDNAGSITLGTGGNIDYTDMTVNATSTGGASIKAVGGTETIVIDSFTISGGLNITFEAQTLSVIGDLTIEPDSVLTLIAETGGVTPSVCNVQDSTNGLIISTGNIVTTDTCNTISGGLSLPAGTVTVGTLDPNATLTTTGTVTITPGSFTPTIDSGGITLLPEILTQELLSSLSDGVELPTEDGNTCTLIAGECVAENGTKYSVVDGKLVSAPDPVPAPAAESSGLLNLAVLYVLFMLLLSCRCAGSIYKKASPINI